MDHGENELNLLVQCMQQQCKYHVLYQKITIWFYPNNHIINTILYLNSFDHFFANEYTNTARISFRIGVFNFPTEVVIYITL